MRLLLALAAAALTLALTTTAATAAPAAPCTKAELAWGGECWNFVRERAHFDVWLSDRGVRAVDWSRKRPKVAARFGKFWPFTRESSRAAVRSVWPEHTWQVLECIIERESGWWHRAFNGVYPDRSWGLLQINTLAHRVPDEVRLWDPLYNAKVGYQLYQRAGWSPWRGGRWPCF